MLFVVVSVVEGRGEVEEKEVAKKRMETESGVLEGVGDLDGGGIRRTI